MFKPDEVNFERLKKQLEALDYNEPLGIESFPLVQHLFNDLYMTTTSMQSLKTEYEESERKQKQMSKQVIPLRKEVEKLHRDNNQLHTELIELNAKHTSEMGKMLTDYNELKSNYNRTNFILNQQKHKCNSYANEISDLKRELNEHYNKTVAVIPMSKMKPVLSEIYKKSGINMSYPLKPSSNQKSDMNTTTTTLNTSINKSFLSPEGAEMIDATNKEKEEYKNKIAELEKKIEDLNNQLKIRDEEIMLYSNNNHLNDDKMTAEFKKDVNVTTLSELNYQVKYLNEEMIEKDKEIEKQKNIVDKLLKYKTDAEVLKRSNKELKDQMKRITEELHTIDSMGKTVRNTYGSASEQMKSLEDQLNAKSRYCDTLQDQINKLYKKVNILTAEKEKLNEEFSYVNKQLEAAKDKHKLDNVRKIEELNKTVEQLNKEISDLKKSYTAIEEEKSELESANRSLNEEILNENKDVKLKYEIVKEELDNIKNKSSNTLMFNNYEDINIIKEENNNNQFIDSLQTQLQDTLMKTMSYENELNRKDEIISKLQQQLNENSDSNDDDNSNRNAVDYTVIKHDLSEENEKLKYEINRRDEEINRLYQIINEKDNMLEMYQTLSSPIQINTNTNISKDLVYQQCDSVDIDIPPPPPYEGIISSEYDQQKIIELSALRNEVNTLNTQNRIFEQDIRNKDMIINNLKIELNDVKMNNNQSSLQYNQNIFQLENSNLTQADLINEINSLRSNIILIDKEKDEITDELDQLTLQYNDLESKYNEEVNQRITSQQNELNERNQLSEYMLIVNRSEKRIKEYESKIERLKDEKEKLYNELQLKKGELKNYITDLKNVTHENQNLFEENGRLNSEITKLKQQLNKQTTQLDNYDTQMKMKDEEIKDIYMQYREVCDENKLLTRQVNALKKGSKDIVKELNSVGLDKNKLLEIKQNLEKDLKEKSLYIEQLEENISKLSVKLHEYTLLLDEAKLNMSNLQKELGEESNLKDSIYDSKSELEKQIVEYHKKLNIINTKYECKLSEVEYLKKQIMELKSSNKNLEASLSAARIENAKLEQKME